MLGLLGVSYLLVLERKDVPGANLLAKQIQQPVEEIPVEIPNVDGDIDGRLNQERE